MMCVLCVCCVCVYALCECTDHDGLWEWGEDGGLGRAGLEAAPEEILHHLQDTTRDTRREEGRGGFRTSQRAGTQSRQQHTEEASGRVTGRWSMLTGTDPPHPPLDMSNMLKPLPSSLRACSK